MTIIEESAEASSAEESEETKPEAQDKKPLSPEKQRKKRAIIIAIVTSLVLIIAIGISLLILFCQTNKSDSDEPKNEQSTTEDNSKDKTKDETSKVDFNQKVTGPDGEDFSPQYKLGSKSNLVARFPDLKCTNEKCENVDQVKLGKRTLKRGEDFEVKKGSIVITIFSTTLETLPAGEYELTFEVESKTGKILRIGLKITVEDKNPTCKDSEVLKDGQCVKKDNNSSESSTSKPSENKPNNSGSSNSNTNKPGNTPDANKPDNDTSFEQQVCEVQAGPSRVLMVHWMTDLEIATESARDESYWEMFMGDRYNPGDEVLVTGEVWDTKETGMKWLNGKCQPRIRGASNMAGGADYVTRYNSKIPTEANRPRRDAVVWYWRDGSSRVEFIDGDVFTFIRNHI